MTQGSNEKALANAMLDGIIVLDRNLNMLWWNTSAKKMLALRVATHKNQPLQQIFPTEEYPKLSQFSELHALSVTSPTQPNHLLSINLTAYGEAQYLMVLENITRTARLESMRRDFVANVSHELRTPLTVFHGYLEILQDQEQVDLARLRDIFQQMSNQTRRMEQLVEDLLLLSRLESDQPNENARQWVNIAKLLETICQDARSLSGPLGHNITLDCDHNLLLNGNVEELRSAFSNLIFNAVRYTPARGDIHVRWYLDDSGAHMSVSDTGVGIPKKYIPRITQRFYRVDKARSSTGKGGTGLGLAIVKHVMLRHHATLKIDSQVNVGSTFSCSFARDQVEVLS